MRTRKDMDIKTTRSRLTTGAVVVDGDMRTAAGRRWRDLHATYMGAIERNAGGNVSEPTRQLCKYLVTLTCWAEAQCGRLAADESGTAVFPVADFAKVTGLISRLLTRLGLDADAVAVAESDDGFPDDRDNSLVFPSLPARRHARAAE
jgi:hypothetical protein